MNSRVPILMLMLLSAIGCGEDRVEFKRHLRLAQQGDPYAQQTVAFMYATGEGVRMDCSKALQWLESSASQGLDATQAQLGQVLCTGYCSTNRKSEGLKWLTKAADQGNPYVQAETGIAYATGACGEPPNLTQAYKWLTLAGFEKALRARDSLAEGMSNDEVVAAEAMVSSWTPAQGINDETMRIREQVLSGDEPFPPVPDLAAIDQDLDALARKDGLPTD
jgi:TPR repeat protein